MMKNPYNILRYIVLAITVALCTNTDAAQNMVKAETAATLSAKADSAYNSKTIPRPQTYTRP